MSILINLTLFVILINITTLLSVPDQCSKDGECENETSTFVPIFNPILLKIENSLKSYVPCESKNCSCFFGTLNKDLEPFQNGITKEMIDKIRHRGSTYVIYNNKLYRSKDCMFPARCSGIEYFLIKIKNKMKNSEFVINTRDWPQISKHFNEFGPVFSFSKTDEYYDILFPAWSFWEGGPAISIYPTGLGRWDLHVQTLTKAAERFPWEDKINKGFFRGSRTSQERDILILVSRKFPDILDAQYTKNQAWKTPADTLGAEPAKEVSLEDHCMYRYLFNFRGVAASFRFKHLFLCGSVVIHFGNDWYEFFYPSLKPWVHYIPMSHRSTEDDILKMMEFLQNNENIAKNIAKRGKEVILNQLTMKNVKCYWKNLLKRYSSLLKYDVVLDKNLIEIK